MMSMLKMRDQSDLELMHMIEERYGTDNLLKYPSGVWVFNGSIWALLSDAELKATAMQVLAEKVDKVMNNRVASATALFKYYNFDKEERFELGPSNIIVMKDGYYSLENQKWKKAPPKKELYRRIQIDATYTDSEPEQFNKFLDDILCDVNANPLQDAEQMRALIWEMLGYCLVTHTRFEQCFILCGQGANGKSVLGSLAKEMVGRKLTASVQPSKMGNVFQRSNLEGKLLNLVTELNQNEELEDGLLKAIVSGEMMSVERKFQDVREIEPFAKHIILTNHMPRIRDYSDGLFRRISIINLHRQFMGSSADPYLLDKLKGEMDAITSRALDALQRLIEGNGKFTQPESSHNAKLKWKADNNHVEQFISDCLYPLPNNQVGVQDMYDAYIEWFKTTGLRGQLGRKQFVYRMEALGIEKTTRNSEGYSFKEVKLR